MRRPITVPGWVILSMVVVVGAHVVAGAATAATISLMRGASEFAQTVRANDLTWLPLWRSIVYPTAIGSCVLYLWPIISFFRCGGETAGTPPPLVQRKNEMIGQR